MKWTALILCLIVFIASSSSSQQSEFPKLAGPYLGQKPPGMTPEIFAPGLVSKEGDQAKLNISPDLSEIIYWERKPPDNLNTIVRIVREGEQWTAPESLPFSKDYINNEPSLSPDGNTLFFVSNRPRNKGGEPERTPDIWFVEKVEGKWGEPKNLGFPINTEGVEVQPFMSAEPCFYFCRPPAEIFCSEWNAGKWQEPVKLSGKINRGRVSSPRVSPDMTCMIFHSNNPGGFGGYDLYVSSKDASDDWTEARNMGPAINTVADEGDATFSPDGKHVFFSRGGDIYWISGKIIDDFRPIASPGRTTPQVSGDE
ncbi:MAG: PD40 domain-containing protein [Candidatus Aminicenantes bacterium]|nr:PD40 domain-containing protein [Candidatus Aminicenantes bacterium]